MNPTILGIIALIFGGGWKVYPFFQKFFQKNVNNPAWATLAPVAEPAQINRLEALRHAELVLQYLEQNDLDEGQEALREVVAILFSTPGKE